MSANVKPDLGARVMWEYGQRGYVTFGEIGTVIGHSEDGYDVEMDDEQPYHRDCFGAASKRNGHGRMQHFTTDTVLPLRDVYTLNAKRFRAVAEAFERAASEIAP